MGLIAKTVAKILSKYRYRSAKTGRYVSRAFAERNPDSTVREKI